MTDLYLFRSALRDLLRPRRLMAMLALAALPPAFALLWKVSAPQGKFQPEVVYNTLEAGLVFGFLLVILSAIVGTGVISQEIEQKTVVYLLTRPVPRWRILTVKFLAGVLTVILAVCLTSLLVALISHGASELESSRLRRDLLILPVGALAYGAVYLLLAALLNRPLLYALGFAFGWESWVPNLPGNFQKVSLMTYLRVLAPHPKPQAESVEISEILAAFNPQKISASTAWWVLLAVSAIALALALIWFSTHEYVPREDAE